MGISIPIPRKGESKEDFLRRLLNRSNRFNTIPIPVEAGVREYKKKHVIK